MRYGQIVMGPAGSGKVSSRFRLLHYIYAVYKRVIMRGPQLVEINYHEPY